MKRWMKAIFLVILVYLLGGCSRQSDQSGQYVYNIYYLNASMTKLVPQQYYTDENDPNQLVQDLMEQFLNVPANVDSQPCLPSDKVAYSGYWKEDMVLYVYFDNNYTSKVAMSPTREVLCRAALTKTMTQIDGIEYLYIYTGDQPLLDADGNAVGMLSALDFVESVSDVNNFEKIELTLYFTDQAGEALVETRQQVIHNVNSSLEKLIVEQLMKGPEQGNVYPTLPKDIKLLNVSVNENICYINFDAAFINSGLEVKDYIPIYSIVNSLVALPTVNRVQISINGSQDVIFRDSISLDQLFERNFEVGGMENK